MTTSCVTPSQTSRENQSPTQHHAPSATRDHLSIARIMRIVSLALVAWVAVCTPAQAQTGQVMPSPKFEAYDSNGGPCNSCRLYAYLAGTTTPTNTYTTSALSTPNAHPVVMDAAGRATVFISPSVSYKFTLKTAADVDIYTVDNVVGPFSGVITIEAADTRGLQITRVGANAGLSIASTGGSGKTYGIDSTTTGALRIRDDADGTPAIEFLGNNITAALTGTFTVSGGLFAVSGFGTHELSAGGTNGNILGVRNTTSGTANFGRFQVGNNTLAAGATITAYSSAHSTAASQVYIESSLAGTMVVGTNSTSGAALQFITNGVARATISAAGATTATDFQAGLLRSSSAQPGFLAYNSADDIIVGTNTVDFDTEIYDTATNFAADTFTAPVTGVYMLCVMVTHFTTRLDPARLVTLVTSNRNYRISALDTGDDVARQIASGCVFADMDAADTAHVTAVSAAGGTVVGTGSPHHTYFSGRLMP